MSVITKASDDYCGTKGKGKCSVCGETLRLYPFLHWHGDTDFFLCARCCKNIKSGLIADLVHAVAIKELQDTDTVYENYTFVRKHIKELEAEGKSKWPPVQKIR